MRFYDEMANGLDLGGSSKVIAFWEDFNRYLGKCTEGFKVYMRVNGIGKKFRKRKIAEFCDEKSCAWQTLGFVRQTKGKSLIALMDVKQKLILYL